MHRLASNHNEALEGFIFKASRSKWPSLQLLCGAVGHTYTLLLIRKSDGCRCNLQQTFQALLTRPSIAHYKVFSLLQFKI